MIVNPGGGGAPLEDSVTSPGGASIAYSEALEGPTPHVITFTEDEDDPILAADVKYSDTQTVKAAIDDLKASVSDGKSLVASAITDKGVTTAQDATFSQMATNIGMIETGVDTSDATASSNDVLYSKTAYGASGKITGSIPSKGAQTFTPGTSAQTISSGQYLSGNQIISGDTNLKSANIKQGISIFGVTGTYAPAVTAYPTMTVTIKNSTPYTVKFVYPQVLFSYINYPTSEEKANFIGANYGAVSANSSATVTDVPAQSGGLAMLGMTVSPESYDSWAGQSSRGGSYLPCPYMEVGIIQKSGSCTITINCD